MADRLVMQPLKTHYPSTIIIVSLMHALLLTMALPSLHGNSNQSHIEKALRRDDAIKISNIRTVGIKNGSKLSSVYVPPKKAQMVRAASPAPRKKLSMETSAASTPAAAKNQLSLDQLAAAMPTPTELMKARAAEMPKKNIATTRPGTRPEVGPRKKAIDAISLKGNEMKRFVQGSDAIALSGDDRGAASKSDVMVKLEVPEGVSEDELNEYEMMFYGFQRRTAINYINSFYQNLDEFQKKNPHLHFPMIDGKQLMTGRLTYDEKGNIKQIKMIRWSNEDKLQEFFENVLRDMDTLHNPPQALWQKSGEFSIFFSLMVNG